MRTIRCSACNTTVALPKDKAPTRVRCPTCGEDIPLKQSADDATGLDELELADETEPEPARRRPRSKFWRRLWKKILFARPVEFLESGPVIRRSTSKTLRELAQIAAFLLACLAGVALGPFLVALKMGIVKGAPPPTWVIAIGFGIGVLGLVVGVIYALEMMFHVGLWRREERLILGKTYVQCIVGKDRARLQLPYDHIAELCIGYTRHDNIAAISQNSASTPGVVIPYIGIDLKGGRRKDTIVDPGMEQWGRDVVIRDYYELPLDELFVKLLKRWTNVTQQSGHRQQEELRSYRKRAMYGKVASYFLLAVFAAPFLLAAVALVGWFFVGKGGQPPMNDVGKKIMKEMEDRSALDKLARTPPDETQEQVARQLAEKADSPDVFTRQAVIKALATWATPKEVPVLIKALTDENIFIRQDALKGIGRFHDDRALPGVLRCFEDASTQGVAAKALCEMGPMAEKDVLALLDKPDMRGPAIKVLKDIGTQQSVPALEALSGKGRWADQARETLAAIAARSQK